MAPTDRQAAAVQEFDEAFRARLAALFVWRRDVRRFRREPVPRGTAAQLAGTCGPSAPSVGLSHQWRFVMVDDAGRRAAVRANFAPATPRLWPARNLTRTRTPYAQLKLAGLDVGACHIAVCTDPNPEQGHGLGRRNMPETTD